MTTKIGYPLADCYLRHLNQAARRLPRSQRRELVAEIEAHVAAGLADADSEAAVKNLLDDLGDPDEIVQAALKPQLPSSRRGKTALVLAVVAAVFSPLPLVGAVVAIPLGVTAAVLGMRSRRAARAEGTTDSFASAGVVVGLVAVVVSVLFAVAAGLLVTSTSTSETAGSSPSPSWQGDQVVEGTSRAGVLDRTSPTPNQ